MLKAIQCESCGSPMTVTKMAEIQQVACPQCRHVITVQPSPIDKNTIVGNRYQLKERFEENQFAALYRAVDLETSADSLLRVYPSALSSNISNADEFLHTASSASHLAEPAHLSIIDYGNDDGHIYTAFPYEDLESIESIVKRDGPLDPPMAVSICKDLALSLDKANHAAGIGHFNLKPSCIFLNAQGQLRYCDFGISAHLAGDPLFMQSGYSLWSVNYLSPEMAMGWSYPDFKSDMYAVASVLYFMVVGNDPHADARTVQEINYDSLQFSKSLSSKLGRIFEDFFFTMTARNPAQRYMSWSQAVSQMDQFLYEHKGEGTSLRQRAGITKLHDADKFDNIKISSLPRKKKNANNSSKSQSRMSAEDVRRKFSVNNDGPKSFGRSSGASVKQRRSSASGMIKKSGTGSQRKTSKSSATGAYRKSGSRTSVQLKPTGGGSSSTSGTRPPQSSASTRKSSATGSTRKSSATGVHRKSSATGVHRKSSATGAYPKKRKEEPEENKKSNAAVMVLGILLGLMVIGFLIVAAVTGDKGPRTADKPKDTFVEEESKIDKSQFVKKDDGTENVSTGVGGANTVNKPANEEDNDPVTVKKDPVVVKKDPADKVETPVNPDNGGNVNNNTNVANDPKPDNTGPELSRLRKIINSAKDDLLDKESDNYLIERKLKTAKMLAEGDTKVLSEISQLESQFAQRRRLAVRLAYNEVAQEVRLLQLKRKFDEAMEKCDKYDGPFAEDIKEELQALKAKVLEAKNEPFEPPVADNNKNGEDKNPPKEDDKPPVTESTVTIKDFTDLISEGKSTAALNMLPMIEKKFGKQIENLDSLKAILEKSTPEAVDKQMIAYFKSMSGKVIEVVIEGQTLSGILESISSERRTLTVEVDFNGQKLMRVLKLDEAAKPINYVDNFEAGSDSERAMMKTIILARQGETVEALRAMQNYQGPLKAQIAKRFQFEMGKVASTKLQEVLKVVSLPSLESKEFADKAAKIKVNKEDGWLAMYKFERFKNDFSSTLFFKENLEKLALLSRALLRAGQGAARADVVVSPTGSVPGTQTLESALLKAKSGMVIRLLPGDYKGNLVIKEKGIAIYGCSGAGIATSLKVNADKVILKQVVFRDGDVDLGIKVSDVEIINCRFIKDGVNMLGENSGIHFKNSIIFGISAKSNKRIEVKDCTILEKVTKSGRGNSYNCIKGSLDADFVNTVLYARNEHMISFNSAEASKLSFKHCLFYGGMSLAFIDNKTRISDEKAFKKEVGRTSSVILGEPTFNNIASGDYRLKDFTPGFLSGENKKSIGVQMGADLKLLDVR